MKATKKQSPSGYCIARDSEANTQLRKILADSRHLLERIMALKLSAASEELVADTRTARQDYDPRMVNDIAELASYHHGFSWALEQFIVQLDCQTIPTLEESFERAERAGNPGRKPR